MEGVGARLGRSSTRYGPATVFTGPVRKWKKKWVPISNPNHTNNLANANNGNGNGNNSSRLLLYKWTPMNNSPNDGGKDAASEEPRRKKFRYLPVSVSEEKKDAAAKTEDETKPTDANPSPRPRQSDDSDGKPDVSTVLTEESQIANKDRADIPHDARETTLDLSLGLNGEQQTDVKTTDQSELGRAGEAEDAEMKPATISEVEDRSKKDPVPDLEK